MPGVQGRTALVTGASRGIGLATARLLIQQGARVMAVSRSAADLAATGLEHYVAADLSTLDGCQRAVEATLTAFDCQSIDLLIVNHGIGSAHEVPLYEQDMDTFQQSIQTNLQGPYYLTRLVMPLQVAQKYGRCVYTSSTAAIDAEYAGAGYNTSKTGLLGLMRSVCQDGGPHNITANAVCPGWVRTEMADRSAAAEAQQRKTTVEHIWAERSALASAKRVVTPEEVAHTIVFLASEESSGVSGESIRVSLGCPI